MPKTLAITKGGSGGGTPGGSDKQVQFNDSSAFGGATKLTYDKATGFIGINSSTYNQYLNINGNIEIQGTNFKIGNSTSSISGTNSVYVGYGGGATNDYASAYGYLSNAAGVDSSAFGRQSSATVNAQAACAIGKGANTDSPFTVATGQGATILDGANYSVVVGASSIGSNCIYSVVVGSGTTLTGAAGFAIGALNTMAHARSGVIGVSAATTTTRQLMIGSTDGDHYLQTVLNGNLFITNQIDSVTLKVQAVASQTNDLFQANKSDATVYTSLGATGKVNKYNSIATVSNGVPSELATVDLTAQTAAKTTTTLYTPAATGLFRISIYLQVTTAATTSSILGGATGVVITYTDGDGSVAQTNTAALATTAGAIAVTAAGNTTATNLEGTMVIYAKTGVAIQYAIGYTSVGATPMAYAAHLKIEAL